MTSNTKNLVQYVVVHGGLRKSLNWPAGAILAQALHAGIATIHQYYSDENTKKYLEDVDNMHTVVLEAPTEDSLRSLDQILTENSVDHKLWIEQPENIATCIALKPHYKDDVKQYFKKLKLYNF